MRKKAGTRPGWPRFVPGWRTEGRCSIWTSLISTPVTWYPAGTFIRADATTVTFPGASFEAVVCLYALVHMPLEAQPGLLRRAAGWLRPGGWLLAVTGQRAWTGTEDNWLGGPATMWWSHADAATYRAWLEQAGLQVTAQELVPEGDGGHALFWARRPPQP